MLWKPRERGGTIGVEEEFLLADPTTGRPDPLAGEVLTEAAGRGQGLPGHGDR
ncbi:hypothetical protein [Flindersiella endophytica]